MSAPRLTVLLAAMLAVLLAVAALELRHGIDREVVRVPAPDAVATPPAVAAPAFELAGIERLSETTARPLFMPGRRMPVEIESPAVQAPSADRAPDMRRLALSAIVIVEDQRVALLSDLASGSLSRVREGDSVGGWRVLEIRDDSVVIESDASREELPLRTFEAPVLPPPARNPPTVPAQPAAAQAGTEDAGVRRPRRPRRGPRQAEPRSER
ncbi:MAG: hypothetical protein R3286_18855 [Gammaproteobacteria bacterium]|nr:hypothetical protein [Gammaproteobacteria bacterium]